MSIVFEDNGAQSVANLNKKVNQLNKVVNHLKDMVTELIAANSKIIVSLNAVKEIPKEKPVEEVPVEKIAEESAEKLPEGKVACPICGKVCLKRGLNSHMRIHKEKQ